jgi:murein DD-endopeptidase MepM/ murein hydrolase activator NlpD
MKFLVRRRPSASMVVAMSALVVALSGSAIAASRLVTGDNLIRPRSLSGNRLRNHTVTGLQVAAGTLGKVPSAKSADRAFVAGSSQNAVNAQDAFAATNAVHAQNADTVGGEPASSFLPASDRLGTNGLMRVAAGGGPVTLFAFGPFTVKMSCVKSGSTTTLTVTASSTEVGSVIDSAQIPSPVTSATSASNRAAGIDFEAPSGAEAIFAAADGVNSLGTDCWANWVGMS